MEWWLMLTIMFGGLFFMFATGLPVAFCFATFNILGMFFIIGGTGGFSQLIVSMGSSVATFTLLPVPLFILMGEVLWHSGVGTRAIDVLDQWLGRVPGRLSFLAVLAGVVFAGFSGSNMANTALLGSVLSEPMAKKGYHKSMIFGPIMGSGALAMVMPHSALGVLCAVIARVSVGKLLIAIIVPGLILAIFYAAYITARCHFQPELAPPYELTSMPLSVKLVSFVKYLLPLGAIIVFTVVLIFFGVCTPSESAAIGCLASCILGVSIGGFSWVKKSIMATIRVTAMSGIIIMGATAFSQILAYSGASRGMLNSVTDLGLAPIVLIMLMQIILILLGGPMDEISLMMISLPVYMPIVQALGLDPVWFCVLILINVEIALLSPPFGMVLFVMKGVAPQDTTMGDIFKSALPFMGLQALAMGLLIAFPKIALWLPSLMS